LIQVLGTERREWPTRELWNAQRSRIFERVTGITVGPEGSGPSMERTPKYRADMLDEKASRSSRVATESG
jgi:hypothetical protein